MEIREQKPQAFQLWWYGDEMMSPAGVAFYEEEFGEYRLKIDLFGEERQFFLKAVDSDDHNINFRVEVVKKKDGKFFRRAKVGIGSSAKVDAQEIVMRIPPFQHALVMTMGKQ